VFVFRGHGDSLKHDIKTKNLNNTTMKTKTITLYSFDELSEESQKKALENLSDINVNFEWWESTYEDAERVGLKINSFDLDRASYVNAEFTLSAIETAQLIIDNHGENCETYKTAQSFQTDWANAVATHSDGKQLDKVCEDKESEFDEIANELESDFLKSLCEDYRIILTKEYEHLTSKEAIKETIEANEYTFIESGKLENE
jgi:hypothetical protein